MASTASSSDEEAAAAGGAASTGRPRLLGVEIRGLTYESERWRLATVGDWQPSGSHLPQPEVVARLQQVCRELFALFDGRLAHPQSGSADDDARDHAA